MAKYIYPAVFTKENKLYFVQFPDFESCYTQGESLQDAFDMAEDVLALTLYEMEEARTEIPNSSEIKTVKTEENEFVSLVSCDTIAYRKLYDNKAVKKTLTIPSWLNAMAEKQSINFSAVLQNALKEHLDISDR
ncbi:type II toxin-antitoxin system HicB family antitoxin [Scatolibacter rhodanostii]|uniref:type II toxin-antitoxin system HicB family antitoxin n=1 Tax=Scatolibacter rhodanostii TaxID=2014781 RepID=UPI000C08A710|nr:type II toxin-antitoxin system HicB family antitoxin [Scatolibacter rhodanostii]